MAHGHVIHDRSYRDDHIELRRTSLALAPATHALLRIGAGLLFLQHGLQKMFGMLGGFGGNPGATAPMGSLLGFAGVLELVGGALLILGLFVRPAALVLMIEMVVAYFMAHAPRGTWPLENGGELALLYALVFAFLATHGGGTLSADRRLKSPRRWHSSDHLHDAA